MTDARLELWEELCTCGVANKASPNVRMCRCVAPFDAGLDCDECQGVMLIKQARNTGHLFWGCSNYSKDGGCKHTMRYGPPYDRAAAKQLQDLRQANEAKKKRQAEEANTAKQAVPNPYLVGGHASKKARVETPESPAPSKLRIKIPCVTPAATTAKAAVAAESSPSPPANNKPPGFSTPRRQLPKKIILSPEQKARLDKDETICLTLEQKAIMESKRQAALAKQREAAKTRESKEAVHEF